MRIKWFSTIRVIGMLFVLLYHFYISFFPGGFVGVDLFFTLSGYLTTALFLDEYKKQQTIDFKRFFQRRFYRIFPPVAFTLLITTPLALLIRNDFIAGIGRQIMATLGFMTNFFELLSGSSYENQFTPHLFLHTWSLGIEVQFYLLWALIIWGITRFAKTIGHVRGMVFLTSGFLFLTSFLTMFVSSFFVTSFSTIYFATWTHIFPFFLGSILASLTGLNTLTRPFEKVIANWDIKRALSVIAGALAVEVLLLLILPFDSIWTYLIGFLLSSLATATMIYGARVLHEKTEHIKEPAILLSLSNISYGIYLFHWPFYTIFSQLVNHTLAVLLTLVCSILFASISFYLLEPYLAGKNSSFFHINIDLKPYTKWIWGTVAALSLALLGISLFAPKLGNFERESLVNNLYQAQRQMTATRSAAENAQATNYNVEKGTTIIGDSVSVRASEGIQSLLPTAQLDGAVSRNLSEADNLVQLYQNSHSLKENVVIALGTNTSENYQELLDELIEHFPKGHRLIFVTPYDGNHASEQALTYQIGQYERQLAKKYDYISIADWYQVSKENPHIWTNTDLVHFNLATDGAILFAQTIQSALEQADNQPVKP
ncbi:acyltransferase family protein [Streptococcus sp. zg-86]|uniref:Acyltransferase family protein n=1 Tax=Streptococcus zhangguiae TaxID=2664091 RepID=A0A6I4RCF5_9STRE|nr:MULTISPECIES: acyltransferase family protein [unclassified Streptococcus]MTB64461.1 acyltransferase family protein [Streptococcus sp. zg-86]MTB90849.1 acyltransferase family protein [Streptococcus sp. zg-36]MWV56448.1 acyltransferase family protein [Streptococcus sp. zg-70]QTH47345.1 acyltransferase [Streptococcus sp. zg-86]